MVEGLQKMHIVTVVCMLYEMQFICVILMSIMHLEFYENLSG